MLAPFFVCSADPARAKGFIAPPYDVPGDADARAIVSAEPDSFLRVTRPEVAMPVGFDPHSDAAYEVARRLMSKTFAEGLLRNGQQPGYGVYRLTWRGRSQTGLVALASSADYVSGAVARHELTRPDKENDRTRHIVNLRAQTGPVFLAFRGAESLGQILSRISSTVPEIEVDTGDGIFHEAWAVRDVDSVAEISAASRELARLYICDGHHRAAAGTRAGREFPNEPTAQGFLSVAFPHDQLRVLPYHRLVFDLNGRDAARLRSEIESVTEAPRDHSAPAEVDVAGEICIFVGGTWMRRALPAADLSSGDAAARLEASVLQRLVLGPLLGIEDPHTSSRIRFVGGIKGPGELSRAVLSGEAAIGFAMPAVSMDQLFAVAEAGLLMPPKTTWFEPKLRDGMFVNTW